MVEPQIEISYDEVKIENCIVLRPPRISAKQWIDFWEAVSNMDPGAEERLLEEIESLKSEIADLQSENSDLSGMLQEIEKGAGE